MASPTTPADVLGSRVARDLLCSRVPARLAYSGRDTTPRVLPIWFHWNGETLVLASRADAPKMAAIRGQPSVAITIDTERPPYRLLQLRGRAEVQIVDGIVAEYELAAERYYGERVGRLWIERMRAVTGRMARIEVTPTWARMFDVGALFPESRGLD